MSDLAENFLPPHEKVLHNFSGDLNSRKSLAYVVVDAKLLLDTREKIYLSVY